MEHVFCVVCELWVGREHLVRFDFSLLEKIVCVCPDWFSVIHCKSVWRTWVRSFLWNVNAELTTAPFFQRKPFDEYVFVFACEKGIINTFGYVDSTTFMNNHDAAGLCAASHCSVCTCSHKYVDFSVCTHSICPFIFFPDDSTHRAKPSSTYSTRERIRC